MVVCLSGCGFFETTDAVGDAAVASVSVVGWSEEVIAGRVDGVEDDVCAAAVVAVGRFVAVSVS